MLKRKKGNHRREHKRAGRQRVFRQSAWITAVISMVVVVTWGVGTMTKSSWFPLRHVEVEGSFTHIGQQEVRDIVDAWSVQGFFGVNIDAVHDRLLAEPWIKFATVQRVWPDSLRVGIHEHVAVALWNGVQVLNASGEPFASVPHRGIDGLPVLEGPVGSSKKVLDRWAEYVALFHDSGLTLRRLAVNDRQSWELETSSGIRAMLGRLPELDRIGMFAEASRKLFVNESEQIESIDLRYANGFAVRWKDDAVKQVLDETYDQENG